MGLTKSDVQYYLTNFRTRQSYLLFQLFQLLLSIVIIISAISSQNNFRETYVLYMEFVLLLCMSIDLQPIDLYKYRLMIRWISEGQIWTSKHNKIDCIVLAVFTITFIFLCLTNSQEIQQDKSNIKEKILQTDDVVLILIIVIRYALQIFQMIKTIKNTRNNMKIQRQMKDIDLNQEAGHSIVYDDHEVKQDEILRSKITNKRQQSDKETEQ